jgi:hypothetical protein
MSMDFIANYVAELRRRAEERRREGLMQAAEQYELVARELEAKQHIHLDEVLTLAEAALETGYSITQLRRLVRSGEITLRRGDLPRRPGHRMQQLATMDEPRTLADEVLRLRAGGSRRAS